MLSNKILKISIILLAGILIRLYFNIGHIFSDDAYYSYLSYNLLNGDFPGDYLGYPVSPLRINHLILTTFSYSIFGVNEFATLVFPFIFSIGSILLTYKLAALLTKDGSISLTAAVLMAFFPTDVVFATINFVDISTMFFINLGIYFLVKSYKSNKIYLAVWGGAFLFVSMQFKEHIYYTSILLGVLWLYYLVKHQKLNIQISIALLFIISNFLLEGSIYLCLHNDFLYRLTMTELNYQFCFYNFFPYTAEKHSGATSYWENLFNQVFFINGRSVFLRRFYLFLPFVGVIQSIFNFRKKEYKLLTFWFLGTLILLMAFTTSVSGYKPLDLQISWYVFPLFMPMVLLSSIFINKFKSYLKYSLIIIYIAGSFIMCSHYEVYFKKENGNKFKKFLRENPEKFIHTDHFTKYSIDLIRSSYDKKNTSERILGKEFNLVEIKEGDWIVYSKKHVAELRIQKFNFPDFAILSSSTFEEVKSFRDFKVYRKSSK
ncbi:MAG: phospholipid carrier-dependent glycosyltransferase [Ignavibacteriaceae bacterium]|nr:phospholipid carrier-dependent glycosyltransferase [Ignavibacteriaceae bacterium]